MSRIVHLIGAPGSGKSTLAAKFVSLHRHWGHLAIDDYRERYATERAAVEMLTVDVLCSTAPCLIETSGGNRAINRMLDVERKNHRPVLTIRLDCNEKIRRARIVQRGHAPKWTESGKVWPADKAIDSGRHIVEVYRALERAIVPLLEDAIF